MKIWLISTAEQTAVDNAESTRFLCIADAALNRGHDVTFIASTFKHNTKIQRYTEQTTVVHSDRYRTIFLPSKSYKSNLSFDRMYSHWKFSKTLVSFLNTQPIPDIIYLGYPPISMASEVSNFALKKNIPFVLDIIDPWPDTFKHALPGPNFIKNIFLSPFKTRVKGIFNKNNYVTGISNQYIQWASSFGNQVKLLRCFYPAVNFEKIRNQILDLKKTISQENSFNVIYAGSLAISYDVKCILDAAYILNQKYGNKIHFYFAGSGPQDVLINEYETRLTNITFLGRLTKPELMKTYAKCHLGTTQHIKGATQSVTYKLFDLLACGLPILNSLESEMKDIIVNNKVGMHNDPGDAITLASNIEYFYENRNMLEKYQQNGFALTSDFGDANKVYDELISVLEKIEN